MMKIKSPISLIYLLFSFSLILLNFQVSSQTIEFSGTAKLRQYHKVYKIITVPNCPQAYRPPKGSTGTTIKYETKLSNGKTEITVEDKVISAGNDTINIPANKIYKKKMPAEGIANLYLDDKDKTVLYVNYYLNSKKTVDSGLFIEKWYPVYNCSDSVTMTHDNSADRKLSTSQVYYLWKVEPGHDDINSDWFKNSEQIRVKNAAGIQYYLVNRYDRNAKYVLELQNRESIAYSSGSLDLGALTIPFKYRFGFEKDGNKIKDDVAANFNVGIYGGYKLTNYHIINKAGTYTQKTRVALRVGPFINISSVALDSATTTIGTLPFKENEKQNIAVMSTGLGLMLDIRGIQIGIYGGADFGMGSEAKNWNYHKRGWLGFGVGYKITDLFSRKD